MGETVMKLRGIDFGPCIDASGLRGFFGEGYWYHRLPFLNKHWYDFKGSTFVSKTTNYERTLGYMPLDDDFQPVQMFPKCIWVDVFGNKALNAVGLSGPGAQIIFNQGFWRNGWPIDQPFMISVAPEGKTTKDRIASFANIVATFKQYRKLCKNHQFGAQINLTCPNGAVKPSELISEASIYLDMVRDLDIPIIIKINLLVPMEAVKGIADHPSCDAICITNALPFGELPTKVPWDKWFPHGSPLAEFGGGGLSGAPLFPLLLDFVQTMIWSDIQKPIIAGGGITHPDQVNKLVRAGLRPSIDAISIGSIAMLRPWNIPGTIDRAHELLS
jgi:dihydroorotate dehydrogenase